MMQRCVSAVVLAGAMLVPTVASAAAISIFTAPDKTYANTADTPCIFFGPGQSGCSKDPAVWEAPAGPTNGDFSPLTQTYTGADYTVWNSVVGSSFVLGFDVNDTSTPQMLSTLTVDFFNVNTLVGSFAFSPATLTPSTANGVGWADYILSAGCSGTTTGSGVTATCTPTVPGGPTYTPFVTPAGTTRIVFGFALTGGNDGSDRIFAIPVSGGVPTQNCTLPGSCDADLGTAPEPATLLLLGGGLLGAGYRRRRQQKK